MVTPLTMPEFSASTGVPLSWARMRWPMFDASLAMSSSPVQTSGPPKNRWRFLSPSRKPTPTSGWYKAFTRISSACSLFSESDAGVVGLALAFSSESLVAVGTRIARPVQKSLSSMQRKGKGVCTFNYNQVPVAFNEVTLDTRVNCIFWARQVGLQLLLV